ncbi:MAG: polyphosphate kinase 1 [Cyanobacteria bacterium J069]
MSSTQPLPPNWSDPYYYFSRELSWIEFNARVLHEAIDDRTPLLERLKFAAIFSSNLDEFFMVRVAGIKRQIQAQVDRRSLDGRTPREQLEAICQKLQPLVTKQHQHVQSALRPQLATHGVYLLDYAALNQAQQRYLRQYFEERIFPVLTPLAVDPGHPFPHISNLSLNLAVVVQGKQDEISHFARLKVPNSLPRFVPLPLELQRRKQTPVWMGVPVEQIIAHNLEKLFPGMDVLACHVFRVTRNADLEVQEDEADDLLQAIEQELRKRRFAGSVVRLEIHESMPAAIRQTLMVEMGLGDADVYPVVGLLGGSDLMALVDLPLPRLKDAPWKPVVHPRLRRLTESEYTTDEDFFALVRRRDLLVHHPFQSFSSSVQAFLQRAARDPDVLTIKMTLYRTSGDSPIVDALIAAAENGKQVAVLVELKARFDEENNIQWARKLEQVGVHVVYGLMGLKTHTKLMLVVRQEGDGRGDARGDASGYRLRRYVHIGTGNYNPKTARLYTDLGLLTCREDLGADVTELFNALTGYSRQQSYRKLLVAPTDLRDRLLALIHREREAALAGRHARIVAKMNALVDPALIVALYEASQAGVQIDLIVRGICCLRPGLAGVSDRIRVISIVGRFLEHSRIFYFYNGGAEDVYIGSADWMPRNLDRRVEAVTPIEDEAIAKDLQEILGILLADNRQAWELQPDGSYRQRHPAGPDALQSAQQILMDMAKLP